MNCQAPAVVCHLLNPHHTIRHLVPTHLTLEGRKEDEKGGGADHIVIVVVTQTAPGDPTTHHFPNQHLGLGPQPPKESDHPQERLGQRKIYLIFQKKL